ncbi:hypothetical protein Tco_0265744 [Tanacetum coccineum]
MSKTNIRRRVFKNPSKSLSNLLEIQVIDKLKTGLGYNAASSTVASPAVESSVNSSEIEEYGLLLLLFTPSNVKKGNPQQKEYKEKGVIDSGFSRHMTENKCYLTEYEDYDGCFVFLVAIVRSKNFGKNNVLFTDTECLVLSSDFKANLMKASLAEVPRKDKFLVFNLKSVVPTKGSNSVRHYEHVAFLSDAILLTFDISIVKRVCVIVFEELALKASDRRVWLNILALLSGFGWDILGLIIRWNKDHLGKFHGKADEGYFVGYSVVIVARNQTNGIAGTKDNIVTGQAQKEKEPEQEYILITLCTTDPLISQGPKDSEEDAGMRHIEMDESGASDKNEKDAQDTRSESEMLNQREMQTEHTNSINTITTPVSTAGSSFDNVAPSPPVNTAGPSVSSANAFEEHLFKRFSPFKNAFTLPYVPNVSSMDNTW